VPRGVGDDICDKTALPHLFLHSSRSTILLGYCIAWYLRSPSNSDLTLSQLALFLLVPTKYQGNGPSPPSFLGMRLVCL